MKNDCKLNIFIALLVLTCSICIQSMEQEQDDEEEYNKSEQYIFENLLYDYSSEIEESLEDPYICGFCLRKNKRIDELKADNKRLEIALKSATCMECTKKVLYIEKMQKKVDKLKTKNAVLQKSINNAIIEKPSELKHLKNILASKNIRIDFQCAWITYLENKLKKQKQEVLHGPETSVVKLTKEIEQINIEKKNINAWQTKTDDLFAQAQNYLIDVLCKKEISLAQWQDKLLEINSNTSDDDPRWNTLYNHISKAYDNNSSLENLKNILHTIRTITDRPNKN